MNLFIRRAGTLLATFLLLCCAGSDTSLEHGEWIAFVTDRDGNNEIYVVRTNGTGLKRLTENPASDTNPFWSPDGRKIVFQSNRDGDNNIYLMNRDGTDTKKVTDDKANDWFPVWSYDGKTIYFTSDRNGKKALFVMNPDGSDVRKITGNETIAGQIALSPDTRRLAYVMQQGGIGVADIDGSNMKVLTKELVGGMYPSWSPDGKTIAFGTCCIKARDEGGSGHDLIHVMNPDGGNMRFLAHDFYYDRQPSWSSDGKKIVFTSTRGNTSRYESSGNTDVYLMDADGTNVKRVTDLKAKVYLPRWSPAVK